MADLDTETQAWLKHHHNEALIEETLDAVIAAGGESEGEYTPSTGHEAPACFDLSQVDWHWIRDSA